MSEKDKTCDIVLLSYENPDLLEKCVVSVLHNTDVPSRLIIVDNASRNERVKKYISDLAGNDVVSIEKVFCDRNYGFAGGINRGMRLSTSSFVCILNNDCIVTKSWLSEMISVAVSQKNIGLVNPQSSTFGSIPSPEKGIEKHAAELSCRKGKYTELGHAIGFACLIKREVIDKIGYLDEIFEGVCYEDTDYSMRVLKAGYISVIAEGAYVFHLEQASRKNLKNRDEIYARNLSLFTERWGKILRVLYLDQGLDITQTEFLREDYEMMRALSRQRAFVDMWVKDSKKLVTPGGAYEYLGVIRHADVNLNVFSDAFYGIRFLWKVLTKKKKYDAVILKQGFLSGIVSFFAFTGRYKVFILNYDDRLIGPDGKIFDLVDAVGLAGYLRGE
ncbi:MAG TPA: glycosyltransferase [Candidatus Omnitrophota bacterium]|nr:glycosyltransferase [Candidatus Omnitrophota bacterium]HPS19564.1 glycosyltransferase [Candidatus Omnitrophota bacterium]